MRLVINTSHQRFGGALQVALSFIRECRKFPENQYYVWLGSGLKSIVSSESFPPNFHFSYFDFGRINYRKTFHINRILRRQEARIQPDCVISTTGPSYFHSRVPQIIGFNLPLYIYPESPYLSELSTFEKAKLWMKKQVHIHFFKRDADVLVVQSKDVEHRVKALLGTDLVFTVTNTYNDFFEQKERFSKKLPKKQNGEIRLLTPSAWYPHKNLALIPKLLNFIPDSDQLKLRAVLTLKPEIYNKAFAQYDTRRIFNVGPVPPSEMPSLYEECDLMILPTLAECFSASYAEAMIMGMPILTSDLGFAHGICGNAALYFTPSDYRSAANELLRLLSNKVLWQKLVKAGSERVQQFDTAEIRALKYLSLCRKLVKGNYCKIY